MAEPRRFPPPWSVEETDACFIVRDASGQALAYVSTKGLADSLARPGGSATGVAMMAAQLDGKRASLLHEFVPAARLSRS